MSSEDLSRINSLQIWLQQLYGDECCPILNPEVHDIKSLLNLKAQNEEAEKIVKEEIKLKKAHILSNNIKTDKMKTLLESENVALNEETLTRVDSIAGLAAKMNLEEPDLTNFLLAICQMKNDNIKDEEHRLVNCATLSTFSRQNLKIEKSNKVIKSQLDAIKKTVDIQESNITGLKEKINFFRTKSIEYENSIKISEDGLREMNFDPSLQHSNLVKRSQAIEELEKKLKQATEKLKHYKQLPANERLAKLKILEKQNELENLQEKFTTLLDIWEKIDDKPNTEQEKTLTSNSDSIE